MAEVSVKLVLDSKKQLSSRLFFLSREDDYEWTQNFVLTKEVPFCKTYDVYLIVSFTHCVALYCPGVLTQVTLIISAAAQRPRQADGTGGAAERAAAGACRGEGGGQAEPRARAAAPPPPGHRRPHRQGHRQHPEGLRRGQYLHSRSQNYPQQVKYRHRRFHAA